MKTNTELSVNIDKTNYVIFQSKQKKSIQDLSLLINWWQIDQLKTTDKIAWCPAGWKPFMETSY